MTPEAVVYACTCDFAGKVRGKGFPATDFEKRLKRGIGWAPTNTQLTCFDLIAESPFGALGDRVLIPDPTTRVSLRSEEQDIAEDFVLGDILNLDGSPWSMCTRSILKSALERLHQVAGLRLLSAFEHEFQFTSNPMGIGQAYTLQGLSSRRLFAERLIGAMRAAGLGPDTIMKEYAPEQLEVTMDPAEGVTSADHAVILRQLVYSIARACGETVTFTPLREPGGVGNGVHIHFSLLDDRGAPAAFDPHSRYRLSEMAGQFIAGILKYLDSILALTAPSVVSYGRLTPHRWSAAFNNLGLQDREAAVRICPVSTMSDIEPARQYNIEFRAGDASASPYLHLAAIVHAGVQGIEEGLQPPEATEEDLALLSSDELHRRGYIRLPTSLPDALARFAENATVHNWFAPDFPEVYRKHKEGEMRFLDEMDEAEVHRAYESVY